MVRSKSVCVPPRGHRRPRSPAAGMLCHAGDRGGWAGGGDRGARCRGRARALVAAARRPAAPRRIPRRARRPRCPPRYPGHAGAVLVGVLCAVPGHPADLRGGRRALRGRDLPGDRRRVTPGRGTAAGHLAYPDGARRRFDRPDRPAGHRYPRQGAGDRGDRGAAPGRSRAMTALLDPRGPRFAAGVTTVVLALALIFSSGWLTLAQALVFAVSAWSPRFSPYGLVYRLLLAPRLPRPTELEPAAPVRFAQLVGFVFTAVATAGYLTGLSVLGLVFTAFALIAAFLNAAFGLCLGCEVYLAFRRLTGRPVPARVPAPGA